MTMSQCCSTQESNQNRRHTCPINGKQYLQVPYATVLHHVDKPWQLHLKDQRYYFCDDPHCEVVYFGLDNTIINKTSIRTLVGVKQTSDDAPLCYCFGISKSEAKLNNQAKAFTVAQTKQGNCSCTTSNPSGRCCLKDFPK